MELWPTVTMPCMPYVVLIMKMIDFLMAKAHKFSMLWDLSANTIAKDPKKKERKKEKTTKARPKTILPWLNTVMQWTKLT